MRIVRKVRCAALLIALTQAPPVIGQSPTGSSVKLYQVNGDCDWVEWDASISAKSPACLPTTSQTASRADVLGDDVPVAFEHNGELIVTFGDTIGAAGYSAWTNVKNSFEWNASFRDNDFPAIGCASGLKQFPG